MTTPEHALVGMHVAVAFGLQLKLGWPGVAIFSLASILPDWDGLLILIDISLFDRGHRVWGHNLISIVGTSLVLAYSEFRWRWIASSVHRLRQYLQSSSGQSLAAIGATTAPPPSFISLVAIAMLAQLLHLPCDMIVSGGAGLSDWAIQPWWPFSDRSYVYPMIPWGDVGPTVLLMAGAILSAKVPKFVSTISKATLLLLICYLVVRGWMRGTLGLG